MYMFFIADSREGALPARIVVHCKEESKADIA